MIQRWLFRPFEGPLMELLMVETRRGSSEGEILFTSLSPLSAKLFLYLGDVKHLVLWNIICQVLAVHCIMKVKRVFKIYFVTGAKNPALVSCSANWTGALLQLLCLYKIHGVPKVGFVFFSDFHEILFLLCPKKPKNPRVKI